MKDEKVLLSVRLCSRVTPGMAREIRELGESQDPQMDEAKTMRWLLEKGLERLAKKRGKR